MSITSVTYGVKRRWDSGGSGRLSRHPPRRPISRVAQRSRGPVWLVVAGLDPGGLLLDESDRALKGTHESGEGRTFTTDSKRMADLGGAPAIAAERIVGQPCPGHRSFTGCPARREQGKLREKARVRGRHGLMPSRRFAKKHALLPVPNGRLRGRRSSPAAVLPRGWWLSRPPRRETVPAERLARASRRALEWLARVGRFEPWRVARDEPADWPRPDRVLAGGIAVTGGPKMPAGTRERGTSGDINSSRSLRCLKGSSSLPSRCCSSGGRVSPSIRFVRACAYHTRSHGFPFAYFGCWLASF